MTAATASSSATSAPIQTTTQELSPMADIEPPDVRNAAGSTWRRSGYCWFYCGKALGNRVWKSNIPTHSGVMAIRTVGIPRTVLTQAGPCSGP